MDARYYCDLCTEQASCFCFCRSTKTKLCDTCFPKHANKLPSSNHTKFPLTAFKFLEAMGDFELFRKRGETVSKLVARLEMSEAQVVQDLDLAQSRIDEEEQRLIELVRERMQSARQMVAGAGKKFEVELKALKDQVQQTSHIKDLDVSQLAHNLVADLERALKHLDSLKLQIEFKDESITDPGFDLYHLNIESVLGWLSQTLQVGDQNTRSTAARLFTFNPYTPALGIFSPAEQSICLHNINSEFELFDLSSWTFLSTGQLAIAGGRGRCTRSVYLVDPYETSIQKLPPMRVNRRRPGLIEFKSALYVFGGYRDDYLKESERLVLSEKAWSDVEDMIIARSGMTPVMLGDKAYLAGDGSSLVEEYEFEADAYHLLSFKLPFNSWVTAFVIDEVVYFLQRNTIVTAKCSESGLEKVAVKALEVKNWWYSQATPVVYEGKAYFPRYHEIWSFDPVALSLDKVNEFS